MRKTEHGQQCPDIHIAVENFGPIEKAEMDLRPLTVFVGESNTGKTYLSALIYALQNAFGGFARIPLPHAVILLLKQSRFRFQTELDDETLETLKKLNTYEQPFKFSDLPQWLRTHILRAFNNSELFESKLKRCFNLGSISELIRFTGSKGNELRVSLKVGEENQPLWNFEMKDSGSDITVDGNVNEGMILRIKDDTVSQGILDLEDLEALSGYPEFRYRPQKVEQALRMSQSSSMVSELAPLVLFLRGIVQPGDTLIIEEPEAHLHPAAQTKVALTLARLVRIGVRVIITTHSDWLLEQIGNLVREREVMKLGKNKTEPTTWLTKEEVGAWWFRTDTPVKEITFEHIAGIEPEEYGEVAEELYNHAAWLWKHLSSNPISQWN